MSQKQDPTSYLNEESLSEARVLAATRRLAAWQEIADLVKTPRVRIGGDLPGRDELYRR